MAEVALRDFPPLVLFLGGHNGGIRHPFSVPSQPRAEGGTFKIRGLESTATGASDARA
jgi:hypothetical protein